MTLLELLPSLHQAATPRLDRSIWPLTTHVDEGRLCVGGVALTEVADEFRTPTYVVDEEDFRQRIRRYRATLPGIEVVYAGKSLLTTAVAHWVAEEGIGLDVCSGGELAIALAGGVDPSRIIMHGNAKTPDELRDAATIGVGRIVVDSPIEIAFLAGRVRRRQQVLLRVIPGIDIHGHPAVTTGVAEVRDTHGVVLSELNIGGGHGVPYVCGDRALNLDELANVIDTALTTACAAHRFPRPTVVIEPGRAISARAGVTL